MNTLRAWREKGASRFLLQLAAAGALAGLAAWLLVAGIRSLGVASSAGGTGLSSALLRGTFFGLAVGVILDLRWRLGRRS